MILVKLYGGLGNQMFQYAAGRALALRRNDRLALDLRWYETDRGATPRQFELGALSVAAEVAGPQVLSRLEGRRWFRRPVLLTQRGRQLDRRLLEVEARDVILDGYWQCESYFIDVRPTLLEELEPRTEPGEDNRRLLDRIGAADLPVAVHVRRGDYVSSAPTAALHGTCSLEYYRMGAGIVRERFGGQEATFFVFSDDPEWVAANLQLDGPVLYVSHNDARRGWEDLRLMRACKGFVIANSTFSWWGAWLSEAEEKVVVAPKPWFADPEADEGDIVPESWIRCAAAS